MLFDKLVNHASIAVVIVNYNSGALLKRCLSGLKKQSLKPDRIVIVDNASSDDSLEGIITSQTNIEIVNVGENAGFAAGNNLALKRIGDCQWIALLNPDAVPKKDWLEVLVETAASNKDFACFACRMLLQADPKYLDGAGDIYHVSGLAWRRGHGLLSCEKFLSQEEVFSPCAGAALYRRDILFELGGFDENFFCYFEDVDLGFRFRLAGYKCLYVPEATVYHVGSATTGKRSDFTVYHGQRNLVWAYLKNMPWPLLWLYLPQHILVNIASLVLGMWRGQMKVIVKAKWDAIKGLPRVLCERHKIQRRRRVSTWQLRQAMGKGLSMLYQRRAR